MFLRRDPPPKRRASAMVETAVVLIPLCLFVFAVMEYGRIIMILQVMNNAAREGARQASSLPITTQTNAQATATINATITNYLANQNLKNVNIQIFEADTNGNYLDVWTSADFGQNIQVQIDADFPLIFPTFGFLPNSGAAANSMHLRVKSMMHSEAN